MSCALGTTPAQCPDPRVNEIDRSGRARTSWCQIHIEEQVRERLAIRFPESDLIDEPIVAKLLFVL
jgi:hypothetical protein